VAELAIDHPSQCAWIATQLGNGENRSAAMVKHCGMNILPKLASLGFAIETSADIALVSEVVFNRGIPKGALKAVLFREYEANKLLQADGAVAPQLAAVPPWGGAVSLLSKPVAK
jgi:hypothetical protein